MKNLILIAFKLMWLIILISLTIPISGQNKINVSTGIGLPELINVGIGYELKRGQVRGSVGFFPSGTNEQVISVSADFYYNFGKPSSVSGRHTWYARGGLNFFREETDAFNDQYLHFTARVGRDMYITDRLGIAIDLGAMLELYYERERKQPSSNSGFAVDIDIPVIPSGGISLFVRI